MEVKVEIISKETIKPSSPTPPHLSILKLSLLDQYIVRRPMSLILFFSASASNVESKSTADRLKRSLSETLTQFYPLAGRINDNQVIHCNDEGVHFSEARASGLQLNQILTNPRQEEMVRLLPRDDFYQSEDILLSVQLSVLDCGGMALGVCMDHKAADASSRCLFLNTWASIARRDTVTTASLKYNIVDLFPPKDIPSLKAGVATGKVAYRRFVFDECSISALRAKSSNSLVIEHASRVEAISALLWGCGMNVSRMRENVTAKFLPSALVFAVNLRGRLEPPLSNLSVGNAVILKIAMFHPEHLPELPFLAGKIRESIRQVDGDFVKKLQGDDGFLPQQCALLAEIRAQSIKGELDLYVFSSWCRFPFYEADFGWGKPAWIVPIILGTRNVAFLMDNKCGNGVEAWVSLSEEDMARFESEPELIAFTQQSTIPNFE